MEIMKKLMFALALMLPLGARAQTYTYALPQTVISLEVTAENDLRQYRSGKGDLSEPFRTGPGIGRRWPVRAQLPVAFPFAVRR